MPYKDKNKNRQYQREWAKKNAKPLPEKFRLAKLMANQLYDLWKRDPENPENEDYLRRMRESNRRYRNTEHGKLERKLSRSKWRYRKKYGPFWELAKLRHELKKELSSA